MSKPVHCRTFLQKSIGVMFKNKFPPHIFHFAQPQHILIHTWFVRTPLDLYFFDRTKKLIEIKKNLKPLSFYKSKKKAKFMVEIKAGKKPDLEII